MKIKRRYKTLNSNKLYIKPLLINVTCKIIYWGFHGAFYPDFHSTASRVLNVNLVAFKESIFILVNYFIFNSQMNLIQLCEFVDVEIICCSGIILLSDPLWKMPYQFSNF